MLIQVRVQPFPGPELLTPLAACAADLADGLNDAEPKKLDVGFPLSRKIRATFLDTMLAEPGPVTSHPSASKAAHRPRCATGCPHEWDSQTRCQWRCLYGTGICEHLSWRQLRESCNCLLRFEHDVS